MARARRFGAGGDARPLVLALLLGLACDRAPGPPTAPVDGGPPPSPIEAVAPPAKAEGVAWPSPVWVQFSVAPDTTTLSTRTVFLKAETRRVPITLAWDPATRRLRITPVDPLALYQAYTVELAATIAFVDGTTLGRTYAWQFVTLSLRRPESPLPMDGRRGESPFVTLRWRGLTEVSAGKAIYEVHAEADSAAAADPSRPPIGTVSTGVFMPRVRWREDGPTYWAIHAFNTVTRQRLVGPVWRFETIPPVAAIDSVAMNITDWAWVDPNTGRTHCYEDSVVMGPGFPCTVRWATGLPDSAVRLAGAAIDMTPRYASVPAIPGESVWLVTSFWSPCVLGLAGPPFTDESAGRLANAVVVAPDHLRFASDGLAAHLEFMLRLGQTYGYLFRSDVRRSFRTPLDAVPAARAVMWLYYRRSTPAPVAARLAAGPRRR